jgi:hypothetical protein
MLASSRDPMRRKGRLDGWQCIAVQAGGRRASVLPYVCTSRGLRGRFPVQLESHTLQISFVSSQIGRGGKKGGRTSVTP